jgi:hypothetical protein
MNQPSHEPTPRAVPEADRVIAHYGHPPAPEVRRQIEQTLAQQREEFLALERLKSRPRPGREGFDDRGR